MIGTRCLIINTRCLLSVMSFPFYKYFNINILYYLLLKDSGREFYCLHHKNFYLVFTFSVMAFVGGSVYEKRHLYPEQILTKGFLVFSGPIGSIEWQKKSLPKFDLRKGVKLGNIQDGHHWPLKSDNNWGRTTILVCTIGF